MDEALLPEVRRQFEQCDGHAIFSDRALPEDATDIVQVNVTQQKEPRTVGHWLYHRNMVGVMPSWAHLLSKGLAEGYDWIVHTELDHFMSPDRVRASIRAWLDVLRGGTEGDKDAIGQPMLLMWGNAFLFNQKLVKEMQRQWPQIGKTEPAGKRSAGCPSFMRGRAEWPDHCSQDMVYPALPSVMGNIRVYGPSGCGQPEHTNQKGTVFPLTCWDFGPLGREEKGELESIRVIALMDTLESPEAAHEHFKNSDQEQFWKNWYLARHVPILHHALWPSVHQLARELLH